MYRLILIFGAFLIGIQAFGQRGNRYQESEVQDENKFIEAKGKILLGDYEDGIKILREMTKKDPNNHTASFELARAYRQMEDGENAVAFAEKASNSNPSNTVYKYFLVDQYEMNNDISKGIAILDELILSSPDNPVFYEQKAFLHLKNGKSAEAINALNSLENRIGVNERLSKRKFEIQKKQGNIKGAETELVKLSEKFPANVGYLYNLSNFYKNTKQKDKEIKSLESILKINPDEAKAAFILSQLQNKTVADGQLIQFVQDESLSLDEKILRLIPIVEKININSSENEKTEIIQVSEILVTENPKSAKAHAIAGDIAYGIGETEKAMNLYQKTLDIDDRVFAVWQQLMSTQTELKQWPQLLKTSEKAIDLFPIQSIAFISHGRALIESSKYKKAGSYLMEAHMIAGKNQAIQNEIYLIEALSDIRQSDSAEATKKINKVLENRGDQSPTHLEIIGDLYQELNDSAKAAKYWKKAKTLGNTNKSLFDKLNGER